MVRASPKMELIKNEKARNLSFQRRKTSMKKKLDELSTLCGVEALMLVYGPHNQYDKPAEPEHWPPYRRVKVQQLFNKYKNQSADDRKKRTVNLSHYLEERKKKLQKTNEEEAKSEQHIDDLGKEEKLGEFISWLDSQIAAAKARLDLLTNNNRKPNVIVFSTRPEVPRTLYKSNSEEVCYSQPLAVIYPQEPLVCYPRPIAAIYPQQPLDYNQLQQPRFDYNQLQQHGLGASFGTNLTPNSRAMVLWNNNGCAGACGSNIVHAPLNSVSAFYGPMTSGMVNRNTIASRNCYYYGVQALQQPMPQYYVQHPTITRAAAASASASAYPRITRAAAAASASASASAYPRITRAAAAASASASASASAYPRITRAAAASTSASAYPRITRAAAASASAYPRITRAASACASYQVRASQIDQHY